MKMMKTGDKGIKYLVLLELFSPYPYSEQEPLLTEEERERAYRRFKEGSDDKKDWKYIFEGVENKEKIVELLELLDRED